MAGPVDSAGRHIDYLRISVTDRCNLRCIYCMPPEGVAQMPHSEILSYEEIRSVARAAVELGFKKIRLTGGEPLVRAELPKLIEMLSQIEGINELSLTTNGTLLKRYALELRQAGLSRINVSLDTLKGDKFRQITRNGKLRDVLEGIAAAKAAGFEPVKINTVVMRGMNDDEVLDFARMTRDEGWHVRFIELMPFKAVAEFVPSDELRQQIRSLGKLEPCLSITGNGPAAYYRLAGARGSIGFISPLTELSFCSRCNRIRLTAEGKLRPCLLGEDEIDLKTALRNNASMEELKRLILEAVATKPRHHRLEGGDARPVRRRMSQIGG
jgi:cyclic pyranopterin phosphate synthase